MTLATSHISSRGHLSLSRKKQRTRERAEGRALVMKSSGKNYDAFFWVSPRKESDLDVNYSHAEVLWHFPENVSTTTSAFMDIPNFCFPDLETLRLEKPLQESCRAENFTFILTDQDGGRVNGVCLRFLPPGRGRRFGIERRVRHCLCFITTQPFTSILHLALLQVHSLALLDPGGVDKAPGPDSHQLYFLQQLYDQPVPGLGGSLSHITIPASPKHSLFHPFQLPLTPQHLSDSRKMAPLADILGLDTFFTIMCAILCERRIVFVADDVDTLSAAVHAAAAMISPFQWQHVFIPILPSSLLSYAAAPVPFIIGVRRYLFTQLVNEALEDVIIVDVDSGDCTIMGRGKTDPVPNFFEDSSAAGIESTEKAGSGTINAMKSMFKTTRKVESLYIREGGNASSCEQMLAAVASDLRSAWNAKPREGSMIGQMSGKSAADSSKDSWMLTFNSSLESSIMMLYVYLFGDIIQDFDKHAAAKFTAEGCVGGRGTVNESQDFGVGDSRAAFNLKKFRMRRKTNGTTAAVESFLDAFTHSQMFERFCADWVLIQQERERGCNGGEEVAVSGWDMDSSHVYVQVCLALREKNLSLNIDNIRAAVKAVLSKSSDISNDSSDNTKRFHELALKVTSKSSSASTVSMSSGGSSSLFRLGSKDKRSSVNLTLDCGFEYGYGQGLEEDLNKICYDAATNANQFAAVSRTIWLRLEDCRMFNWKHGVRGLQLLHCMLLQGPPGIITEALSNFALVHSLMEYRIADSSACTAERRLQIRTVARNIVKLLLDQGHLALRRQYGDQVRRKLLPYVGLQKQLAARMALRMQRDALVQRATASTSLDKLSIKSNNSKRLSALNPGSDPYASQTKHPQSIDRIPDFLSKHEQYQQMMEIMHVEVFDGAGVVVLSDDNDAPGDKARRRSIRRASIRRSNSFPVEEECLLDFSLIEMNDSNPQTQAASLNTPITEGIFDDKDPFKDFNRNFNESPVSSPKLDHADIRFTNQKQNTVPVHSEVCEKTYDPFSDFDSTIRSPNNSPMPLPIKQNHSFVPGSPNKSSTQQVPRGGLDAFGFPVQSSGTNFNSNSTNSNTFDPFATGSTSSLAGFSSDPFGEFNQSTNTDPFSSSSRDPFSAGFSGNMNKQEFNTNNRVPDDGFGMQFSLNNITKQPPSNNDILSLRMDSSVFGSGNNTPSPSMMQMQRSNHEDPFASLSSHDNKKNNTNSAMLRQQQSSKNEDPFANIGTWK